MESPIALLKKSNPDLGIKVHRKLREIERRLNTKAYQLSWHSVSDAAILIELQVLSGIEASEVLGFLKTASHGKILYVPGDLITFGDPSTLARSIFLSTKQSTARHVLSSHALEFMAYRETLLDLRLIQPVKSITSNDSSFVRLPSAIWDKSIETAGYPKCEYERIREYFAEEDNANEKAQIAFDSSQDDKNYAFLIEGDVEDGDNYWNAEGSLADESLDQQLQDSAFRNNQNRFN